MACVIIKFTQNGKLNEIHKRNYVKSNECDHGSLTWSWAHVFLHLELEREFPLTMHFIDGLQIWILPTLNFSCLFTWMMSITYDQLIKRMVGENFIKSEMEENITPYRKWVNISKFGCNPWQKFEKEWDSFWGGWKRLEGKRFFMGKWARQLFPRNVRHIQS